MKLLKIIALVISGFILLCLMGVFFLFQSLPDLCANTIISEYPSPNGKLKAVKFVRDCGATTDFSTQVSILPISQVLKNEGGNVLVSDTNRGLAPSGLGRGPDVQLEWVNNTQLRAEYHHRTRIVKSETQFQNVHVVYKIY